ncbi:YlaH-like family protein [Virgibacillus sp. W0430]|uniref:YlaH-like family protein n=1 Tax=Virgibacillus sp. W0430 TaxID=3391580 RepID=UPI003F45BC52
MDTNFNIIFEYIVTNYGTNNIFWIFYIINLILAIIAYELGFARKLPLIKTLVVYVMLAVGNYIITIFSLLQYPITETLIVISLVLGVYRFRLYRQRKSKTK